MACPSLHRLVRLTTSVLVVVFLLVSFTTARASHSAGGEMSYKYLGNNKYEITVKLYQDCESGLPDAIHQDDPVFITVYDGLNTQISTDTIGSTSVRHLNANYVGCDNLNPFCLHEEVFTEVYTLLPNSTGYKFAYQRCCRNKVDNVDSTAYNGQSLYCVVPPIATLTNNSAVFNTAVPQVVCQPISIQMDFGATDPDGDSLSYEFCEPYRAGSNANPKPLPEAPPYVPLNFTSPFSVSTPLGSYDALHVNPVTGLVSGVPDKRGVYLFAVACREWRNGVNINTVRKEYEITVSTNEFIFSIHPNPVRFSIQLELLNLKGTAFVSVYDMSGRMVRYAELKGPRGSVDMWQLPSGIYFLKYLNGDDQRVFKFVKYD